MMCASRGSLEKLGITASLDKKNSPSSERWCRYPCGVVDVELERRATRQRLAPEQLVIPTQCRTTSSGISSRRRVGSEVEGDVDRIAQTHLSTVHRDRD